MSKLLERVAAEINGEFSRENHEMPELVRSALVWVPLSKIQDNPYQPRQTYDPSHIVSLAHSIYSMKDDLRSTQGLQQPPMGRIGKIGADGSFTPAPQLVYSDQPALRRMLAEPDTVLQLMFGHSRLRAFRVLSEGVQALFPEWEPSIDEPLPPIDSDYTGMPIALGFATDEQMWKHAITENSQRKDINAIEEAQAIKQAIDLFGYTYEQAAQPFGYSAKGTVANKIRLLQLPAAVQRDIAAGILTERHGRELLRLVADEAQLKEVHQQATKKGLTVAQISQEVNWRADQIKTKQEQARQLAVAQQILDEGWTPPGSAEPLPADRLAMARYGFDTDEDKAILEAGLCGSHCQCCVLSYRSYSPGSLVRPDAERAPNIGVHCSNGYETVSAKRVALRLLRSEGQIEPTKAERRAAEERARRLAKAEELNRQGRAKWDAAVAEMDKAAQWQDVHFWRAVGSKISGWKLEVLAQNATTVQELHQRLLDNMYESVRGYSSDVGEIVPDQGDLDRLISSLTGPTQKPEQPKPGKQEE